MVAIHSEEESKFVGNLSASAASGWSWLGGETNGTFLRDFFWTDKSETVFSAFAEWSLEIDKALVIRKDGKWSYSNFNAKHSTLCQKRSKKCFPETEARIKITQRVVNALEGNVTRLVENFVHTQMRLNSEVNRIKSEMNTTGDDIEALLNSTNGLQKQIDIILEYLATLTKAMQKLIQE
ncbi:hypothetical protein B4U79_16229 [Dinothrombium tinctorium]|uniref:C-type lectin domain-containing protein n=1 Tax=Dinothrombium tinctorium TaxID=1965070 RepID=A0A3S3Q8X2_9ACAR|nr:hypothetical protein B4U79_16307 [Dinothrombium tinctorium]RWS05626.1 hypothetical protein B4U79_16295 [Dinothrombium tinctorium]RWS06304.1 hypothetical protein B4U79_16229 [Dinothrombium tinctorium]